MYDYIDRPLASLEDGPRFLVWAMRHWVQTMDQRRCPACAIGPAFVKWRMMPGRAPFQAMMTALNMHGLRNICFAPVCCDHVCEDEAMLLGLIVGVRHRTPEKMAEALALIVDKDQVKPLLDAMLRLTDTMAEAQILPDKAARSTSRR